MNGDPILVRSGQRWKMRLFSLLLLGSGGAMIWGLTHLNAAYGVPLLMGGTLGALLSLVFASLAIRCPSCGAKWFWHAISQLDQSQWLFAVQHMTECHRCNFGRLAP
jgi:hypothetical protein